jgi:DNA polymerase
VRRPPDPAVEEIRRTAADCPSLDLLHEHVVRCVGCPELVVQRRTVVPGEFPAGARLLLVGEAPGAQEDETGRPFVGKGGQLLNRLLDDAGLRRQSVAVANTLKCRPPGNRPPTRAEMHRCRGWLDRQVELVDPRLVVTLGGTALSWALGTGHRLADMRGRLHAWQGRSLLPTYHPSAALRFGPNGAPMAALADDLRLAAARIAEPA